MNCSCKFTINGSSTDDTALSIDDLAYEYVMWISVYGKGRNGNGVRFGQYIYNKYNIEAGNSYNVESALEAYKLLINEVV